MNVRHWKDDRGAGFVAAFIVLFGVLGAAGIGVLIDGGRLLAAHRQCDSIALEAARAGANTLDIELTRAGHMTLDPAAAQSAAHAAAAAFVSGTGASLTHVEVDGLRVSVGVSTSVDPWFPLLAGRTVSSAASAIATDSITASQGGLGP